MQEPDDWKRTFDDEMIIVPLRVLQLCEQALDETRGLVQRIKSHEDSGCCQLDARDRRAVGWGLKALDALREHLRERA